MGVACVSSRRFVGVVTRLQTVFHDVLHAELFDTLASYLLDLKAPHLVAAGIFSSDADVLCWLTNPLTQEAVTYSSEDGCGASASAVGVGWIAIVNDSSSAVFEMSKTGLSSAVAVMAAAGARVSVARRFTTAASAMGWLSTSSPADVLQVLTASAGAEGPPVEAPYAGAVASPLATGGEQVLSCRSAKGAALPAGVMRITSSASSRGTGSAVCGSFVASTSSAAPPDADLWAACSAGVRVAGSTRGRDDEPALPLPFTPTKKRRIEAAAALPSVVNPLGQATACASDVTPPTDEPVVVRASTSDDGGPPDDQLRAATPGARQGAAGPTGVAGAKHVSASVAPPSSASPLSSCNRSGSSALRGATSVGLSSSLVSMGADELPMPPSRHRRPIALGPLSSQAATGDWDPLFEQLSAAEQSTFVSGGPGVGKTTFLRRFSIFLRNQQPADGAVVICAPMGSSAHSAGGVTYDSFFGLPKEYEPQESDAALEATRLLRQPKFRPVRRRLAQVRVLMLDEVSMVPANRLDVLVQLLEQSRSLSTPACIFYVFGDFLQLRSHVGDWAFNARCWPRLFADNVLELTKVHRQHELEYIEAIQDARFGVYSSALKKLVDSRAVSGASYDAIATKVLHLVPTHKLVLAHNKKCLGRLSPEGGLRRSVAIDRVALDRDAPEQLTPKQAEDLIKSVSRRSRDAALADCLAPPLVPHCLNARVMYTSNAKLTLGLFHGCIGYVSAYLPDGTAVVRFPDMRLPPGVRMKEVHDAGDNWVEVCCPAVDYEARMYSFKGVVAVRKQVPFVLGWAVTIHRSQSLTLTEAVLDIDGAFDAGMVHTAVSRVSDSSRVYVKSFNPLRLFAAPSVVKLYLETWVRV